MSQPSDHDPATVLIDTNIPAIRMIRLNRPAVMNALTRDMVASINRELDNAAADASCRVVIITGVGRGFCSGQDMAAANLRNKTGSTGVVEKMYWQEQFSGMAARIRALPQPVIAAVNGAAVGAGMGIALAADIRIISTTAKFLVGSVKIGLSAGETGISYHLPRWVGAGRAFEILLTGRAIEAAEALQLGLATKMVENDQLEAASIAQAHAIMANSPFSVRQTKNLMWASLDAKGLDDVIALENRTQILATMTEDYKEATAAFIAKRPPEFKGV
ncbi:MAG: enoyl-CoA hydratase-related protein [Acidocella sp.]|nr:enoyl-CoA hydratase-related protein [Acidocella sp.]